MKNLLLRRLFSVLRRHTNWTRSKPVIFSLTLVTAGATGARAAGFAYRVTDPLVAAVSHAVAAPGVGEVNTAFWQLGGDAPVGICRPTTWEIGPDGLIIRGNNGGIGVPILWAIAGDFRIQLFVELPPNSRGGAGFTEYPLLCSPYTAIHAVAGNGTPDSLGGIPGIRYVTGGEAAYFLFRKQGTMLTIQRGDGSGVSDASPVVASGSVGAESFFTLSAGQGCPSVTDAGANNGFVRVKDLILEADRLVPFAPNVASPPAAWSTSVGPCVETTFSDTSFCDRDWNLTLFQSGNGGAMAAYQQTSGGNPGAYRRVINTVNSGNPSLIFGFHRFIGRIYDPAVRGAIETVDYAEDSFLFVGCCDGQASGPALRQNGKVFIWQSLLTGAPAAWTRQTIAGLRQNDFHELVGGAALFDFGSHPDFSAGGAPIEVGFFRANSTTGSGYTTEAGIDNWSLTFRRCNQPPGCTPLPSGAVGWWPGDGNANDIIGGHNGTVVGNTTFAAGVVGQAFNLPGSSAVESHIEAADAPDLRMTGPLSLDAWVAFQAVDPSSPLIGNAPIVAKWGDTRSGTAGYGLFILRNGVLVFAVSPNGSAVVRVDAPASLPFNSFVHVAGVYTGTRLELYVNGTLVNAAPFSGPVFPTSVPLVIGGYSSQVTSGRDSIVGVIDEVEVFSRALDVAELQSIYNAGSAGKCKPVANLPPIAMCQNVIVPAGPACNSNASIDNGSADPDGDPFTLSQSPPGPYPLGTTTVTLTVTDDKGASSRCTATVTVIDNQRPTIACPAATSVQCLGDIPAPDLDAVTATDNCGAVTKSHVGDTYATAGCIIIVTRTYKATDAAGNMATCSQIITVRDITPPSITCPADVAVQCVADVPAPNFAGGSVSDNCDPAPVVSHVSDVASGTCPKIITRTYKATDACGNMATCTQTILVQDTTRPSITCPANKVLTCGDSTAPANTGAATATDNCDPNPTVTYSDSVAGGPCPQIITRTWKATDACGNYSTCVQTITLNAGANPCPTYQFNGFLPPIGGADATGGSFANPLRAFKLGSTIPVKFEASCNGAAVTSGIHTLQVIKYSSATVSDPPINATSTDADTAGNQFRPTGGQWHFNLSTQNLTAGTWKLVVTLGDANNSKHEVWIILKK